MNNRIGAATSIRQKPAKGQLGHPASALGFGHQADEDAPPVYLRLPVTFTTRELSSMIRVKDEGEESIFLLENKAFFL